MTAPIDPVGSCLTLTSVIMLLVALRITARSNMIDGVEQPTRSELSTETITAEKIEFDTVSPMLWYVF